MKHVLHSVCAICSMFTSIRLLNKILIVWAAKWTKFGRTGIVTKAFDCHERRHKGSLEGVRSGPGFVCWSCTASKPMIFVWGWSYNAQVYYQLWYYRVGLFKTRLSVDKAKHGARDQTCNPRTVLMMMVVRMMMMTMTTMAVMMRVMMTMTMTMTKLLIAPLVWRDSHSPDCFFALWSPRHQRPENI